MNQPVNEEEIVQKFRRRMSERVKNQMMQKFFRMDRDTVELEVPLFTEYSGEKLIIPYRNTSCLSPKCVYDIEELVSKYEKSVYSNYLNFICHTCRRMIDIDNFYRDSELTRIIEKIWNKYNINNKILCSRVIIGRDGDWEPVLPAYVRRLEQLLVKDIEQAKPSKKTKITDFEKEDDDLQVALQKITVYESIPMIDEFDSEEYKALLAEFVNDDKPRVDNEIILRRYNQQLKWGEWIHLRNQTAFLTSCMGIYIRYLSDFFGRRVQQEIPLAFGVIKVTSFDRFRYRPEFYYVTENFDHLPGPIVESCAKAVFVIHFDERWILVIVNVRDAKVKVLDFLDDGISRYRQDEIYEMACYFAQTVCPPLIIAKLFGNSQQERDQLNAQLIQAQLSELKKKVQFYTDCGHHLAQYLYYWIKQEIDSRGTAIQQVQMKVGEKDLFTSRICWLLLRMTQDTPVEVPFYQYKPKDESRPPTEEQHEDSIDQLRKGTRRFTKPLATKQPTMASPKNPTVLKQWDFTRQDSRYKNLSSTVGNILQNMDADTRKAEPSAQKQQARIQKYWQIPVADAPAQDPNKFRKQGFQASQPTLGPMLSKQGSLAQPMLIKQGSLAQQQLPQSSLMKQGSIQSQVSSQPFLVMPRWQLQQYMDKVRQEVTDEYRRQQIANQYFNDVPKYAPVVQQPYQMPQNQSVNSFDQSKVYMRQSEYQQFMGSLKPQASDDQDPELQKLQQELGLDDQDLADMDVYQYNQMLELLDEMGESNDETSKERTKSKKKKKIKQPDPTDEPKQ